jgi:hypothetical protein
MQKHAMALAMTAGSLLAVPAHAQDAPAPSASAPRVELFVGYQGQWRLGGPDSFGRTSRGRSPLLAVNWNVNRRVAFVVDAPTLGVGHSTIAGNWVDYGFLAGPRLRFRAERRVRPFIQATAGVDHGFAFSETALASPFEARQRRTSFQSSVGGGVDVAVGRTLAWRALQVQERTVFGAVEDRHRVSLSSGLVFSFGGRK